MRVGLFGCVWKWYTFFTFPVLTSHMFCVYAVKVQECKHICPSLPLVILEMRTCVYVLGLCYILSNLKLGTLLEIKLSPSNTVCALISHYWVRNMCQVYLWRRMKLCMNVFSCFVQGQTHRALSGCRGPGSKCQTPSLTAWHITAAIRVSHSCYHDNLKPSTLELLGELCRKSLVFGENNFAFIIQSASGYKCQSMWFIKNTSLSSFSSVCRRVYAWHQSRWLIFHNSSVSIALH